MTDPVEDRVRAALGARAAGITLDDLRPSSPPTLRPARRVLTLAIRALVIATALVLVAIVLIPDRDPAVEPAGPGPSQDCTSFVTTGIGPTLGMPQCPYTEGP
ncbi:hypothetical protein [Catenuloplanes japonicus]|uniref:hypothetical protein n=1 Tax=Catenuloplanes japonicus TaxID=33876 RepID=UPI000526511D|nr:hypothetical protein [Catenuloplanes japonicus]